MFKKMMLNYNYTLSMMDKGIMENLNSVMSGCTKEQYLAAYMVLHLGKFGVDFEI